jgi:hypothetical protein
MCKNTHTTHDTGALRRTLGQYPTGVAVVTGQLHKTIALTKR